MSGFSALQGNRQEQERLLRQSNTLYVGNLSFYTTEEQVHELFSKSGDVKRIIIGLDKVKKTACGFCFVEYPLGACQSPRFLRTRGIVGNAVFLGCVGP